MGRLLKAESGHDKTRAGKMMAAVGKAQCFRSVFPGRDCDEEIVKNLLKYLIITFGSCYIGVSNHKLLGGEGGLIKPTLY